MRFHDESAARAHVATLTRRAIVRCPRCSEIVRWGTGRSWTRYFCKEHGWTNALEGSILERSHVPLARWLLAIRLMIASGDTLTAAELFRNLHLGSFHTAQRLRDLLTELKVRSCQSDLELEEHDESSFDPVLLGQSYDEIQECAFDEKHYSEPDTPEFPDVTAILFKHEQKVLRRSKALVLFVSGDEDFDCGCGLDATAEFLGITRDQATALSRLPAARELVTFTGDRITFLVGSRERAWIREICKRQMLAPLLSRGVEQPLPADIWLSLKELYASFQTDRSTRFHVYWYLHKVWERTSRHYKEQELNVRDARLSRHGLQMALVETTTLSLDRCNRYARAIRVVVQSSGYDGSASSFVKILRKAGGLDRAVRKNSRELRAGAKMKGPAAISKQPLQTRPHRPRLPAWTVRPGQDNTVAEQVQAPPHDPLSGRLNAQFRSPDKLNPVSRIPC